MEIHIIVNFMEEGERMLLFAGVIGYLLYGALIAMKCLYKAKLTMTQQVIMNILAPGVGYYYNGFRRRTQLFFTSFAVQFIFLLFNFYTGVLASVMLLFLIYFVYKDYAEHTLIGQLKRLEKIVHKRPVIAIDFATMSVQERREKLLKLYEKTTYEFAIARPLIDELEKWNVRPTLELMFYEGRLRILHYNVNHAMRQYAMCHNESETMAHYIVDSMEKKEIYVLPLTRNITKFPGLVSLKEKNNI